MDVFSTVASAGRAFLRDAAVHAAWQLGLFAALAAPRSVEELAAALAVDARRLRALADVLVLERVLARDGARLALAPPSAPPRPPAPPPHGWGRLAEVLRSGRPLDEPEHAAAFHRHLFDAGAAAARELAARLAPELGAGTILDGGGGAGAYTAALLDAAPAARATLVDRAAVLPFAREALAGYAPRVDFVAGDLLDASTALGGGHALGVLANVLHLHPPDACARLVARVAAAVAPGGRVVIKEVLVEPDRSGPASGLLFALNMALYTDGGDAYDAGQLAAWLRAAGLDEPRAERLAAAPDAVVVSARKINDRGSVIGEINDPGSVIGEINDRGSVSE
ncbi:MAG TPA: methyltransferase [Polyangia bacterium]|nr:methyltransferase [Polyangia bacterium]